MRGKITQRVVWPVLLVPCVIILTGGEIAVAAGWWPGFASSVDRLLLGLGVVAGVMTGVSRRIGPTDESYRLGMVAGERRQRERCARECGHDCDHQAAMRASRTATGEFPIVQQRRRPPLHVVSGGR